MALNRWSLDRLLGWIGTTALVLLFVPMALLLTQHVLASAERSLSQRGQVLARMAAGQIVEPMLVDDRPSLHAVLRKAASADVQARYACVESPDGDIVAHTFDGGHPRGLRELWQRNPAQVVRFRTDSESLLDIPLPILAGQLGTLHMGISRSEAIRAADKMMWLMGIALAGVLSVVLAGARVVASKVSRPLRELEAKVSLFPQEAVGEEGLRIAGTQEVEGLARGFEDMVRRMEALERDRVATQERMVHAERLAALGEMAAGLAHEVHNPLDGMLECLVYLQADPGKSERAAKYYPMLQDGLERVARAMREMLTFARSGQRIRLQTCRVPDMLEALELLVEAQLKGRRVRWNWHSAGSCACLCDRQALVQAGLNLVLNAAEAAEGGTDPAVQIEATCDSKWAYISVGDSGPGVPDELRERVFEPFFTTKPPGKGTGLGLSVSRELIRAAGGELALSPEPSSLGGARFVIRLAKVMLTEHEGERSSGEYPDR